MDIHESDLCLPLNDFYKNPDKQLISQESEAATERTDQVKVVRNEEVSLKPSTPIKRNRVLSHDRIHSPDEVTNRR